MKHPWSLTWSVVTVTSVAFFGSSLAGALLFAGVDLGWEVEPSPAVLLGTNFLATLLIAASLVVPVRRSSLRGRRLTLALFLAIVGLNVVLLQVEGFVFLDRPASFFARAALSGTVRAALLAAMAARLYGRAPPPARLDPGPASPRSASQWFGRFAVAAVSYVVLYFTAGMLIYPAVRSFYEEQDLPVGPWLLPMPIARGTLYVAFALPLVRSQVGTRWHTALTLAALFPMLAGVPDLIAPNPLQPDWVRPYHMLEIGWSNAVFGLLVGFLFWNPRAGDATTKPGGQGLPARVAVMTTAWGEWFSKFRDFSRMVGFLDVRRAPFGPGRRGGREVDPWPPGRRSFELAACRGGGGAVDPGGQRRGGPRSRSAVPGPR